MAEPDAVDRAWARYRSALEQIAELDNGKGEIQSAARHNQFVDEMRAQRSVLRSSASGREAVTGLLSDPRPAVRLWAAGDALTWSEETARQVLEGLRESPDDGLHAVSAKYVLQEFDAGRLA